MASVRWLKVAITCELWNASWRMRLTMSRSTGSAAVASPLADRHSSSAQRFNIFSPHAPTGASGPATPAAGQGRLDRL